MNEYLGREWGQGKGENQNRKSMQTKENKTQNERSNQMYESEEYKIECWRAAAYGVRLLANALPLAITVAALALLIQSVLSQPFTLSCKSEPTHVAAKAEPSNIFQRKEPY